MSDSLMTIAQAAEYLKVCDEEVGAFDYKTRADSFKSRKILENTKDGYRQVFERNTEQVAMGTRIFYKKTKTRLYCRRYAE